MEAAASVVLVSTPTRAHARAGDGSAGTRDEEQKPSEAIFRGHRLLLSAGSGGRDQGNVVVGGGRQQQVYRLGVKKQMPGCCPAAQTGLGGIAVGGG